MVATVAVVAVTTTASRNSPTTTRNHGWISTCPNYANTGSPNAVQAEDAC